MLRLSVEDPELVEAGLNGHCDAFALALNAQLTNRGYEAKIQVITRTRWCDGEQIDDNPMSHVVVAYAGTTWDSSGPNAIERWENDWIQPENLGEEGEDEFDLVDSSPESLIDLRQKRDGCAPCINHQQRFEKHFVGLVLASEPQAVRTLIRSRL